MTFGLKYRNATIFNKSLFKDGDIPYIHYIHDWEIFLLAFRKSFEFYQDFYRSSVCTHADALVFQDLVSRQFKSIHNRSANRPIMGYFCASFLPSQCSDMTEFFILPVSLVK